MYAGTKITMDDVIRGKPLQGVEGRDDDRGRWLMAIVKVKYHERCVMLVVGGCKGGSD